MEIYHGLVCDETQMSWYDPCAATSSGARQTGGTRSATAKAARRPTCRWDLPVGRASLASDSFREESEHEMRYFRFLGLSVSAMTIPRRVWRFVVPVLPLLALLLAGCSAETLRAINEKAAREGTYWEPHSFRAHSAP